MADTADITTSNRKRIPRTHASAPGGRAKVAGVDTWSERLYQRTDPYSQTTSVLRKCYKRSSTCRWCVDTIARETAHLPWAVVPNYQGKIKPRTLNHIIELTHFFNDPNVNEEAFSELIQQMLIDVLVIDRGIIEKVFNVGGSLSEMWARDGATFHPLRDVHGVVQSYVQKYEAVDKSIGFERDEIFFMRLVPTTYSKYGLPIIESIINEVGALLFSIDWIADSFTEDEIPPGILTMGEIGEEAYKRAKADFQQQKGIHGKSRIRVIDNVKDVKWIELTRANAEMQLTELSERLDRIVYRNFDIEYDVAGGNITGLSLTEKLQKIKLIKPLARKIAWKINNEILPHFGYNDVRFQFVIRDTIAEQQRAAASKTYVITGQRSINEERAKDGYPPITGGDRRFMLIGKRLVFVDDLEEMASEYLREAGNNPREGATEQSTEQDQKETDTNSPKETQPVERTRE